MRRDIGALGHRARRRTSRVPPTTCGQMLDLIGKLEAKGLAYRADDGDVNFAVRKFPGYGKLSGKSLDELRAGERVAVLDGKHDPLDFVLWKAAKPDEPADAKWPQPLRPGPPGLAHRVLGDELRAARRALRHPRRRHGPAVPAPRERDRAERRRHAASPSSTSGCTTASSTSTTRRCPSRWATSSPSATCCKRYDGETLRFFMLRTHYRSPFNFSDAQPRRCAQRAAPAVHRAGRRATLPDAADRLVAAAGRGLPRRDERRLQHAAGAWRCCSIWPAS